MTLSGRWSEPIAVAATKWEPLLFKINDEWSILR